MTVDHLAHLERDAAAVVTVLRRTSPDAAVPACPGWVLRDLAVHLGRVHRWATGIVLTGEPGKADASAPADADLADWSADGAAELLAALRRPERECWAFGGRATTAFWVRRQALETAVHRVDAQRAAGAEQPVADDLAEDGIDEVLDVMLPRQLALGRAAPLGASVELVTGTATRRLGDGPPTAVVRGPAGVLLLLLWGRLPAGDPSLVVEGDAAALDRLLAGALTP